MCGTWFKIIWKGKVGGGEGDRKCESVCVCVRV